METKNKIDYTTFSDEELTIEFKKLKKDNMFNAFIIGLLAGISVYSVVKNGFNFLLLILLFFAVILYKRSANYRTVDKEIKKRGIIISK